MSSFSSFIRSFYAKALFVVIVGAIGITAGVHIGYTYFLEDKVITFAGPRIAPVSSLKFAAGDLFPWEPYVTMQGDSGNFEQLLQGKESVVMMVHPGCDRCLDLLALWHKEVRQELRKGVQQIACVPASENEIPAHYLALFEGMTIVFIDGPSWETKYHLTIYPILMGVDKSGFVTHIQFGFDDYIEYPIVNRFCYGRY